jgi:methylitaconate Delta-isomerase
MKRAIRCAIMRGGTSKAVVFAEPDLPQEADARNRLLLAAFGSPDPRQVDGLGGADPLTSKAAIVGPPTAPDSDVDYTFGQVGIAAPNVNYAVSCGNTAAAVALYAVEERLVELRNGSTSVRIHCTNNHKHITAQVRTNGTGTTVRLEFLDPGGGDTGRLLPTGEAQNEIRIANGTCVRFSLVDCGNLYAIIPAAIWSLTGSESPAELDCAPDLLRAIEEVREAIAACFLNDDGRTLPQGRRSARLKVALVGRPSEVGADDGDPLNRLQAHIVARIVNPERVHKAFAVTGAMNLAAAAGIRGTVVAEMLDRPLPADAGAFRIRHPQGIIAPEVAFATDSRQPGVRSIRIERTARRIMDGFVYVPDEETPS